MTVHASYTHHCPACAAFYIPFDSVPCPRCGLLEKERDDFIPLAVTSVRWNMEMYGSYVPGAWFVGGLGDHLLLILFHIFERWKEKPGAGFQSAIDEELSPGDWGDQLYLKDHVALMAQRVYEEMPKTESVTEEPPPDEPLYR